VVRLLFSGKWLALSVLLLVCLGAFGWLGSWQWSRAEQSASPASSPTGADGGSPTSLDDVYSPGEPVPVASVGDRIRVVGEYRSVDQLLVPQRELDDQLGYWVVTPLEMDDGSIIPVVRGWTAEPSATADAPTGKVVVIGVLEASESQAQRGGLPELLPVGQVGAVSSAELLSLWEGDLYQGFVLLDDQRPRSTLAAVPPAELAADSGWSWQNLAYAIQWWLFAAFAVFLWWRMFQADWADRKNGASTITETNLSEAHS